MTRKAKFLEKALDTYAFHRSRLLTHDKWTITQTAKSLRRSIGSICEDLLIARWCKEHEKELLRFDYAYEAIAFIREKQREQDSAEIE
jgi:hypothetical protein